MSRVAATPQTKTPAATQTKPPMAATATSVPQEKIAQRAYEKWMKRGCPQGSDVQDWVEAERELAAEMARSSTMTGTRR